MGSVDFVHTDFNSLVLVPVNRNAGYFATTLCYMVPQGLFFTHILEADTTNIKVGHFGVFGRVGRIVPSVQGILPNGDPFNELDLRLLRVPCFKGLLVRIFEQGRLAV